MGRHCHLLIAESSIKEAGWGLFTKHALKKGDFVHEYVGEVISQEEAERRGVIYDKVRLWVDSHSLFVVVFTYHKYSFLLRQAEHELPVQFNF